MSSGTSYNGWPANSDKGAINVQNFGDSLGFPFPGGVKSGDVFTVLGYVATQLHERVEPCVSGWCWGYTYKQNVNNPSQLSCHASATAIDWNAPDHPNGSSGTFTKEQRGVIYAILDEVQGAVNWLEGYDEMHFEIAVNAATLAKVAASLPTSGPAPEPPAPEEDDDMATLRVFRDKASGVDYAHNPLRLITINSVDAYNLLLSNGWIDVPHGEAEQVNRDLIEWTAGQVVAGGGVADPLI